MTGPPLRLSGASRHGNPALGCIRSVRGAEVSDGYPALARRLRAVPSLTVGRASKCPSTIDGHEGMNAMPSSQLVQARVDREVKEEAAAVLAAMGLSVSDAIRLLLTRVAREKALPFAPLVPNADTVAAMREARAGNLPRFEDVQGLLDDLHADD